MAEKKDRLIELDIFKGLAILLVVCGHVISKNWIDAIDKNPVYTWIYSFHMPLFFFISGFLVNYTYNGDLFNTIRKKVRCLLIPYFVWSLILAPFFHIRQLPSLVDLLLNPSNGYWYIYFLFVFSVSCFFSSSIFRSRYKSLGGALLPCIVFILGDYFYPCILFDRGLQFYPLFMFGLFSSQYSLHQKNKFYQNHFVSLIFVAFIISSFCYCQIDFTWANKVLKLIASFSISIISLYAMNNHLFGKGDKVKMVSYLGQNSIVIYLTHFSFIGLMNMPIIPCYTISPFWTFVLSLSIAIIISLACLLVGKVVEKFEWINRLTYGRGW